MVIFDGVVHNDQHNGTFIVEAADQSAITGPALEATVGLQNVVTGVNIGTIQVVDHNAFMGCIVDDGSHCMQLGIDLLCIVEEGSSAAILIQNGVVVYKCLIPQSKECRGNQGVVANTLCTESNNRTDIVVHFCFVDHTVGGGECRLTAATLDPNVEGNSVLIRNSVQCAQCIQPGGLDFTGNVGEGIGVEGQIVNAGIANTS